MTASVYGVLTTHQMLDKACTTLGQATALLRGLVQGLPDSPSFSHFSFL